MCKRQNTEIKAPSASEGGNMVEIRASVESSTNVHKLENALVATNKKNRVSKLFLYIHIGVLGCSLLSTCINQELIIYVYLIIYISKILE